MLIRSLKAGAAAAALLFACVASAQAPAWPTHTVKIIVPFQAGSATDLISRQFGQALAAEYGQPFIIDNRPGASAMIGSDAAARAAGDGYTLLMSGPASMVTNRFLHKKLSYDPDAFEKIAVVAITPNILLANPALPFKTLPEMVAYAKANPGKLTYASFGTGTTSHIAGEMLKAVAGIDIVHVPYKGAAEAIPALVGGHVSMYFDTIMTGLPFAKDGRLRALGVSNAKRSAMAPAIPTIAEQGYPGFDIAPWYGLVAPKGTPAAIVARLNTSIDRLLKDPVFLEKLVRTGAEARYADPAGFAAMVKTEIPRTGKLVQQSGVTMQ